MKYFCPCCGFQTLDTVNSYDICDVCLWEDDPFQRKNPFSTFGANHESLYDSQKLVLKNIPLEQAEFFMQDGTKVKRTNENFLIKELDSIKEEETLENYVQAFLEG